MHLRLTQNALMDALGPAADIATNRNPQPIAQTVLLSAGPDGVQIAASDYERSLQVVVAEAEVLTPGRIAIPAKHVADTIRTLPRELPLELRVEDERLVVRGEGCKFHVTSYDAEEFPQIPRVDGVATFAVPAEGLARMLNLSAFAMAKEDDPVLAGVCVEVMGRRKMLGITASDRQQLVHLEMPVTIPTELEATQIINRRAIETMGKLLARVEEGDAQIGFTSTKVFLQTPGVTFSGALVNGDYPQYRAIIPPRHDLERQVVVNRGEFLAAIRQCANFMSFDSMTVGATFTDERVTLRGASVEKGEAIRELPITIHVAEGFAPLNGSQIAFDPEVIEHALRRLPDEEVTIHLPLPPNVDPIYAQQKAILRANIGDIKFYFLLLLHVA